MIDIMSYLTEDHIKEAVERYRSFGPLPGILLTFLKSFVPPLPTIVIVGVNAAVYGLWQGFFYSWLGIVSGCLTTFLLVRKLAETVYVQRWARKPKVEKRLEWVRRNSFSYVLVLSFFPVGPFVIINVAAALAGMRLRSFLISVALGKAVMVFAVSYIGHDLARYAEHPVQILYVLLFIIISIYMCRRIEAYFGGKRSNMQEQSEQIRDIGRKSLD
jgi:uncharacterized membrane protein YdjX (TVP38/TMEM64 family)